DRVTEEHPRGMRHEGAADPEHLLLAPGDVTGADVPPFHQPGEVGVHAPEGVLHRPAAPSRVSAGGGGLPRAQVLEHVAALHYLDDAPPDDVRGIEVVDR